MKFLSMKGAKKMKKSNLVCGIVYTLAGVMFLIAALLTDTKLDSILFGLAGAGIAPGLLMIYKYFLLEFTKAF